MKNKYIDKVKISKLDNEITAIANGATSKEMGGKPMVIAIQNEDGIIYREIITIGLGAFLHLVQNIAQLGFTDLYEHDSRQHKHDCLFSHP